MSEGLAEGPVNPSPETGSEGGQENSGGQTGFNPAWSPMLEKLPQEFHNIIAPNLREWDSNYQRDVQEVQSRYAPYQPLIDQNVSIEQIDQALTLAALFQADPQGLYSQLGEWGKTQGWDQGQPVTPEVPAGNEPDDTFSFGEESDITQHPKFQELQQQLEMMMNIVQQGAAQSQQQEADQALIAEEQQLTEKYGEFDPKWVYPYAVQTQSSLEEAVQAYHEFVNNIRSAPRANDGAPPVFSANGNGQLPSTDPNPRKMTKDERMKYVEGILAQQAQQG